MVYNLEPGRKFGFGYLRPEEVDYISSGILFMIVVTSFIILVLNAMYYDPES